MEEPFQPYLHIKKQLVDISLFITGNLGRPFKGTEDLTKIHVISKRLTCTFICSVRNKKPINKI